ncbi:Phage terminase ATPase subunit [Salmonella bongori N268-08]|uniref:Phage terminase ATPase subunit n=1 Tax=Salmonella bongori N268-08 TaxID=1197719 RepID=S5MV64_SALBN|nr:Phage terminase ATPase subunit [Salmonella bongori N268-08]
MTASPTDANGTKKPRKRKLKNHFTEEQIIALREKIMGSLAWHQRGWYEQRHHRKPYDPEVPPDWRNLVFCTRGIA